jgi:hypothetical protein
MAAPQQAALAGLVQTGSHWVPSTLVAVVVVVNLQAQVAAVEEETGQQEQTTQMQGL